MRALRLAALLLVAGPSTAWGQTVTGALGQAVAKIEQVREVKGKKLGVGDFPLTTGSMSEMGTYLADQLDVVLTSRARAAGFDVVTRASLCQVIRENKLWVDDRFDPELHKKLGRFGHADYIIAGKVTGLGHQLAVTLRLLESETGRQVWADSLTVPLDEGLKALLVRPVGSDGCSGSPQVAATAKQDAPPAAPSAADPLQLRLWADKQGPYRIGDTVRFGLRVSRDAYVTLVNIGTSGEVTVIFPNRFNPSHFVRGGQDVMIPPPDSGFTLTVQGPTGFDQVRAIATDESIRIHASDFAGQSATFRSLDRVQTRDLAVGIKAEREKVAPGKWAEDVIAVEVRR